MREGRTEGGSVKSVKPRSRKVASTPLRLIRVGLQRVKLEGPGLHVNSISPEKGRKVKKNGLRQRQLH